jgi:hypothetical protein
MPNRPPSSRAKRAPLGGDPLPVSWAETWRGCLSAVLAVVALLAVISAWTAVRAHHAAQLRARDLPITLRQAQPLLDAIQAYRHDHSQPPAALSDLLPHYLPSIPSPGPAADGGWHYERTERSDCGGWFLAIRVRDEYSPQPVGFGDTFVYHPSHRYPDAAHGGGLTQQLQGWAYYLE